MVPTAFHYANLIDSHEQFNEWFSKGIESHAEHGGTLNEHQLNRLANLFRSENIIIDAKSGVSGAGRGAKEANLYTEIAEGIHSYGITGHRHVPEIEQGLAEAANSKVTVSFTPHLMPMSRGMQSSIYVELAPGASVEDLRQHLKVFYENNAVSVTNILGGGSDNAGSDFVSKAIDIAVTELIAVATPGEVDQVELDRAKQSTKSAILMNLESRMVASEDIGRQILTLGNRKPVEHFLKIVDEISLKDIASIAKKLISSPLTMASHGDIVHVPSYDAVSSKFSSK